MARIRLIGLSNGEQTPFDGKFVVRYDPSWCPPGAEYDGGLLDVTEDPDAALQFSSAAEAMAKYRESFGLRSDGLPNRPLTAFTVEIA